MALLALLATSPTGRMSRDKVIAMLWPDNDGERARHLLSESLYVLRKALGESAVVASGDDLSLNPEVVRADVVAFANAIQAGDLQAATSLYAGPFLDGFFVTDGAEFERWVAGERDRLDREYRRALESLAREWQGRGELAGAVESWRKLAALDPYSSRVALELMRSLDALGERTAALQHARVHATLVRDEYGVEPDAEITELAARLRTAPSGIGGSRRDAEPPRASEVLRGSASPR